MAREPTVISRSLSSFFSGLRSAVNGQQNLGPTTVTDTDGENTIEDVSIIPYMREIDIDFISHNLRPNRETYLWFDNKEMSHFVQSPNKIVLDTKKEFQDFYNSPRELVRLNSGNARVYLAETDQTTDNTTLYVSHFEGLTTNVVTGNTVVGMSSGLLGNVVSYEHRSGLVGPGSNATTIFLSQDAEAATANYYVGNTIVVLTGQAAGQTSNIVGYNAATRSANVSPAFSGMDANAVYTIADSRRPYSSNTRPSLYTTNQGFLTGTLHLPDPQANTEYSFRTGDRIIRLIDNKRNDLSEYSTRAEYVFTSAGLVVDRQQIINRVITTEVLRPPPPPPAQVEVPFQFESSGDERDPMAQSFYVSGQLYPEGVFLTGVTLFFRNKGVLPIEMQIRNMSNGTPTQDILPGGIVIKTSDSINVSTSPNTANSATATLFSFPAPVFLAPDQEYCFNVLTNDYDYDLFVAETGEKIIGTDRIVSRQPYLGSMFKSQNSRTYTPLQDETIMFQLHKAVFGTSGSFVMKETKKDYPLPASAVNGSTGYNHRSANTIFDQFQFQVDAAELPGTKTTWKYKTTTNANNSLETVYNDFRPERNVNMNERKVVYSSIVPTESFYMQAAMQTTNPDVSPVIFHNRSHMVAVENRINNMGISNTDIAIIDGGDGYTPENTAITIVAADGSGANAYVASSNASTGAIESIVVDTAGAGYYSNATITITSSDGANANVVFIGETSKSGGPALARYISDTIELRDGFNAGDLRVWMDAVKPYQGQIAIYYKVRNALDPEIIDDKNWVKMEQYGDEFVFTTNFEPREYEYRPSATSNAISYSTSVATYTTFNEFKLKIVMASSETVPEKIPSGINIRAVALPSDIF